MGQWVVLRHELVGGGWHFDWMIQPDEAAAGGEAGLITFRVGQRPDEPGVVGFRGERIGVHRAAYLSFEGEVSGGRGWVKRVAEGESRVLEDGERFVVVLEGVGGVGTWIGTPDGGTGGGEVGQMYEFRLSDGGEFGHTG